MTDIDNMRQLFMHDLKAVYHVEKGLVEELEAVAKGATDKDLVGLVEEHREETDNHVARLEKIFSILNEEPETHEPQVFTGLKEDLGHLTNDITHTDLTNLVFLSTTIKIERLEISMYESLLMMARELDMGREVKDLLGDNLEDEERTLKELKGLKEDSTLKKLIGKLKT